MNAHPKYDYDALIVGGGIVGLSMALACAHHKLRVALIDRNEFLGPLRDRRVYALSASSLNLFDHLGLTGLREASEPMRDMKIEEAERGRAPSPFKLDFTAPDEQPLAYMLEASRLIAELQMAITAQDNIKVMAQTRVTDLTLEAGFGQTSLDTGRTLRAPIVIAADGGASRIRQWAGIGVRRETYNQSVVVANLQFEKPHHGVSRQIFYHGQPFALLPMTKNRAQIPWFDTHKAAKAAMALSEDEFIREISLRFGGEYGDLSLLSARHTYPVILQIAERYTAQRLALIGDAAHQISPLVGQGLNLGLRDVAALASVLHGAKQTGQDLGGPVLGEYENWRGLDGRTLAMTTDMLTRLYNIQRGPIAHARRLGLAAVNKSAALKTFFAHEASGTTGHIPPLLQKAT